VPKAPPLPQGMNKCLKVAHLRALRPSKIRERSVGAFRDRLCMSGWVMSVPYPFLPQMAKVELY
jgi:hypothetical protein